MRKAIGWLTELNKPAATGRKWVILVGMLWLALAGPRVGKAQELASGGSSSTLHQARQLTDALHRRDDTTAFKLLQSTYPTSQQPVYPPRIYQDFRANPYLGGQLRTAYERLCKNLPAGSLLQKLSLEHASSVEQRQKVLEQLRRDIIKQIQQSNSATLKGFYELVRPTNKLSPDLWADARQLAALRDTFQLTILARFEEVSGGVQSMSAGEKKIIEGVFPQQITKLRQLDESLEGKVARLDSVYSLLAGNQRIKTSTALIKAMDNNNYLLQVRQENVLQAAPTAAQGSGASLETAALDALARFVAKRLKEELNASFFERFNALLHDSSYVELRTLFPSTTRLITRGSVDYSAIVQLLRTAFDKDLRELIFNLGTLLDTPRYRQLLRDAPDNPRSKEYAAKLAADDEAAARAEQRTAQLLRYTRVLLFTLDKLRQGEHPLTVIQLLGEQVSQLPDAKPAARQISGVVLTLAESFVQEGQLGTGWVSKQRVNEMLHDSAVAYRRTFLGLVHQRLLRQAVVLPMLADPARLNQLVFGFANLATSMQEQVDKLQAKAAAVKEEDRPRPDDFVQLYQLGLKIMTFATSNVLLHAPPQVQEADRISQAVLEGYLAAMQGRYGVAVTNLLLITSIAMPTQLRNRAQLLRYAPFMAALAEARNPVEMQQAIEAVALPAGSSAVKRKTFSSITLNAFPGITGGGEYVYAPARTAGMTFARGNWRPDLGFTAPIGLAFARSIRGSVYTAGAYKRRGTALRVAQHYHYYDPEGHEKYIKGQSLGLFLSIIDIGALVLYRLHDSLNTSPLPQEVRFRQVFSPGVWLMYHAGRSPLSLFAGAQLSPQLRRLAVAPTKVEEAASSLRLNAGITIDIPLLTLYSRSEQRQRNDNPALIYTRRVEDLQAVEAQLARSQVAAPAQESGKAQRRREEANDAYSRALLELVRAQKLVSENSKPIPGTSKKASSPPAANEKPH